MRRLAWLPLLPFAACAPATEGPVQERAPSPIVDGSDALDAGDDDDDDDVVAGGSQLRVVTLNTHSFQEGDDSLAKLVAIGEGLAALDVDLVGLNEVISGFAVDGQAVDAADVIQRALEETSGRGYHRASFGFAHWDGGELMSNALLSRTPIIDADSRSLTTTDFWPAPGEQRNVGYARTDVPGVGLVNAFVTHAWGWESADTEAQVHEVKAFMADKLVGDEAIDLLLGDLNTPSTWPHYQTWLSGGPFALHDPAVDEPSVSSAATIVGGEHRVDYVLAGEGWPIAEDPSRSTMRLVFDGADLPVVSDHVGVLAEF